jgi:hypothetical protein
MNRQSACLLRGVGEGISGGSGAQAGNKGLQQGSGGQRWQAANLWRRAAYDEWNNGESDCSVHALFVIK